MAKNSIIFNLNFKSNGQTVMQQLSTNLADVEAAVNAVHNATEKLKKPMEKIYTNAMGAVAINNLIGEAKSAVDALAGSWQDFDEGMRKVNTMAGLGREGLKQLTDQVEELGNDIPKTRRELAEGLYQVISNGVPKDNWIDFLEQSAKASVGGIADLGQVVGVTSTIIKNYGLEWSAATEIQDKIQTTAKNGVTSFEQLAAALPRVTGSAATLGVSVDELMAAFATLTGVTGNTAEVSTQLNAVFTALTKPSSEATQLAKQMGIEFDAAAIKAAGGMRNFLTQLDADISDYASKHGMLEQEIYGRLFGSAESLRALIALNGELSDKFGENIDAMAESTGTIEAAFEEMSESGQSRLQTTQNWIESMTSWAGAAASAVQPLLQYAAAAGQAFIGIQAFTRALKAADFARWGNSIKTALTGGLNAVSKAAKAATVAVKGTSVAVKGLLISTGVGVVLLALSYALGALTDSSEEAVTTMEEAKSATDRLADAENEGVKAAKAKELELQSEMTSLKRLTDGTADATKKVAELNSKYGESMGIHSSISEWYDTLRSKSAAYCKQIGYEARQMALRNQLVELYEKDATLRRDNKRLAASKEVSEKRGTLAAVRQVGGNEAATRLHQAYKKEGGEYAEFAENNRAINENAADIKALNAQLADTNTQIAAVEEETEKASRAARAALDPKKMSVTDLQKAIADCETALKGFSASTPVAEIRKVAAEKKKYEDQLKATQKRLGLKVTGEKKPKESETLRKITGKSTIDDYSHNINVATKRLTGEINAEQDALIQNIKSWKEKANAMTLAAEKARLPEQLNTLADINEHISYQNKVMQLGNDEQRKAAALELKRLNTAQERLELESEPAPLPIEQIATYSQLDEAQQHYHRRLSVANEKERAEINATIAALDKLRQKWEQASAVPPKLAGNAKTIRECEDAITYYTSQVQDATEAELADIQRTITAYERKRRQIMKPLELQATIDGYEDEANVLRRLASMDKKTYRFKVEAVGVEGWGAKIREIDEMLSDPSLTAQGRAQLEALRKDYKDFAKDASNSTEAIMGSFNEFGSLLSTVGDKLEMPELNVAGMIAQAISTLVLSYSQAAAQSAAFGPWFWLGFTAMGLAQLTSVISSIHGLTKFADGGIISGPTIGLMGEYAGAANNPEVVAPLNKLRQLIQPSGGGGTITVRMHGRELVGVLNNENKHRTRTR